MHTFNTMKDDKGLTLIELLITVAVIVIVFAIAVPVVLNITAGVKSDADAVSAQAKADFSAQYFGALGATSVSDADYTYAVFGGETLAKIANGGGQVSVNPTIAYSNFSSWMNGTQNDLTLVSYNMSSKVMVVTQPKATNGMCAFDVSVYSPTGSYLGGAGGSTGKTGFTRSDDGTTCTFTVDGAALESSNAGFTFDPFSQLMTFNAGSWYPNKWFGLAA